MKKNKRKKQYYFHCSDCGQRLKVQLECKFHPGVCQHCYEKRNATRITVDQSLSDWRNLFGFHYEKRNS